MMKFTDTRSLNEFQGFGKDERVPEEWSFVFYKTLTGQICYRLSEEWIQEALSRDSDPGDMRNQSLLQVLNYDLGLDKDLVYSVISDLLGAGVEVVSGRDLRIQSLLRVLNYDLGLDKDIVYSVISDLLGAGVEVVSDRDLRSQSLLWMLMYDLG